MKRKAKHKMPAGLSWIWPIFFWRKCRKCGREFRREWGFKYVMDWGRRCSNIYACRDCCPGPREAEDYLVHRKGWPRPPAPPPQRLVERGGYLGDG